MVSIALLLPYDSEELALTLNAKKKKIKRSDFLKAMSTNGVPERAQLNLIKKMESCIPALLKYIDKSFLPAKM
ncbi:MAG: hypothetical protein A2275_15045 [Bacteroidetes bacterium RIFOXYA12_FULL_35_11]|nr:MAG: hypothetical protein A2X01_17950 [Bacteroidetes bacterium GWF2_35_48]OFY80183.1 MAG: hypothetical protein A2275_15045 [Bacteroidetes bacterium RIFOXYA12_FULL_35_11]OFY93517.1 MAG: hypothetical protein A2491_09440 [Bacteroidetes bacterium RIFOXYC12_FULL_35_7]OFY96810.1 MAG: hypothetical protein A2309_10395 [Bacteroidetes bacterium RIFOXYB2_FULL_35_7]HBX51738.1 toxin HipA [Bacteroidales bacterium]